MTSANVFNLNSVKQGQVLNANAAKGRSKAENPDAAGVFASLMGSNYSTNFNMPSVNTKINNNVLQQTNAADNYDRYQYQDNTIRQVAGDVVTDVIGNSTDTLDQFQGDVVRTVAEQLGVSEDSVKDMMESLGLTAFDLLNPENLAQLAMQLTGETSPMDLLMNDQFQGLMQQMDQLGGQLANELNLQPAQMEELIAQMDILQTPETLTDEEMQVLTDVAGQQTTADTVSADVMPELAQNRDRYEKDAEIIVSKKRSYEAAAGYPGERVCVHNFASATNPGGGVTKGSSAQEECLCRFSTLYFCLNTKEMWAGFYSPHRYAQDPIHNDDCIYTPEVIVFKSDTASPSPLPEKDWYSVNVITCAAPNLRLLPANGMNPGDGNKTVKMTRAQQQALHEKRLTRILDVAVAGGNEVVILGAFGCGAFENDPEAVAAAFSNVIARYRKCFKTIELAIYCSPRDEQNYNIFKREIDTTLR